MKQLFLLGAGVLLLLQLACTSAGTAPAKAPLSAEMRIFSKKSCPTKPSQCAEITLKYPEFSGGDAAVTAAINDTIRHFIMSVVGGNHRLPFSVALDSAAAEFAKTYAEMAEEMSWTMNSDAKVLLQNDKFLSLELDEDSYAGGAHPNYATGLYTFDCSNGKILGIADIVKDTTLLLPMLEKGYRAAKDLKETDSLADVLYPDLKSLPLPQFAAVVPEGVRFFYNDYEVAAHVIGATDIIITWAELGKLADRDRWLGTPASH